LHWSFPPRSTTTSPGAVAEATIAAAATTTSAVTAAVTAFAGQAAPTSVLSFLIYILSFLISGL
jgi:hypothetical protein